MYENDTSTTQHAPRAPSDGDTPTPRTDPKFARESFTMRKMQTWQIVALAIAAAAVLALGVLYI